MVYIEREGYHKFMIETIKELIEQSTQLSGFVAFVAVFVASMIPFMPLPVLYGVIGYNLPVATALLLTVFGSLLGTFTFFLLIRYLFPDRATTYMTKHHAAKRLFERMQTNGFQIVLIARLLPIVPSIAVNLVSAVTPVSSLVFLTATALGKLPLIVIYTVAGNQINLYTGETFIVLIIYTCVLLWMAHVLQKKWELSRHTS